MNQSVALSEAHARPSTVYCQVHWQIFRILGDCGCRWDVFIIWVGESSSEANGNKVLRGCWSVKNNPILYSR
ncbi:hypothetical protein SFRURICE_013245 [Spodoptera frugiperda]|nr:hypothetical protein SFRURICE_013245 [Spodoptera frugiperda]